MLLTGDARGDKILKGLESGRGAGSRGKSMHVDMLKVPHHGSSNNLETGFFKRITADHYVFSGNGEHGNPERETLEMLFDARGEGAVYTIHLTYPIDEIDIERKKDAEKKHKVWSPAEHSLTALFKNNPKFAKKVRIVDENKPHLIDLLEKVDF